MFHKMGIAVAFDLIPRLVWHRKAILESDKPTLSARSESGGLLLSVLTACRPLHSELLLWSPHWSQCRRLSVQYRDQAAQQVALRRCGTQRIAATVASQAMPQVSAAVPLRRLAGFNFKHAGKEVQCALAGQPPTNANCMDTAFGSHRVSHTVCESRIDVSAAGTPIT